MHKDERPALYHLAIDQEQVEFFEDAMRLGSTGFHPSENVDMVIELDVDEVMMKLRAIDCHAGQPQDWRIPIRDHSHLMQKGHGCEPYGAISSMASGLTDKGLLGEFA